MYDDLSESGLFVLVKMCPLSDVLGTRSQYTGDTRPEVSGLGDEESHIDIQHSPNQVGCGFACTPCWDSQMMDRRRCLPTINLRGFC
jgi:hypothetical protein